MDSAEKLPEKEQAMLENALKEGEKLLWTGRPLPYYFNRDMWIFFISGIIWTILVLAGIAAYVLDTMGEGEDFLTRILSCSYLFLFLPLTLGACYAPIWNYNKMKHTVYAITNRRAIILCPQLFIMGLTQKDYTIRPGMIYEHRVRHNGGGDIIFKDVDLLHHYGFGKSTKMRTGFVRLKQVRPVKDLLNELIQETEKQKEAK